MRLWIRILNAIGLAAVILINWLAEQGSIAGVSTGEISAKYPTVITPAGYAFSIWLLIYTLLVCFVVYSFTKSGKINTLVDRIGIYFFLSCVFNIVWIYLWQYEYITSSVFMIYALLITLLIIYFNVFRVKRVKKTAGTRWFIKLPFSIYSGWICVAATVNTAVALTYSNWSMFSENVMGVMLLIIATLLGCWLGVSKKNPVIMLVFVWAFIAIAIKQQANSTILLVSLCAAVTVIVAIIYVVIMRLRGRTATTI